MSRYSILLDDQTETPPAPQPQVADDLSQTPPADNPIQEQSLEIGKEGSREIGKERKRVGVKQPTQVGEASRLFDLNDKPYRKDSFLFTDEEFEALEDRKRDLRRKHDLDTTKQELGRCAIGHLIQDYREHQEDSVVVRILKAKRTYPKVGK